MELIERECRCGSKFKTLPSSQQKYHSQECFRRYDESPMMWDRRGYRLRGMRNQSATAKSTGLPIKSALCGTQTGSLGSESGLYGTKGAISKESELISEKPRNGNTMSESQIPGTPQKYENETEESVQALLEKSDESAGESETKKSLSKNAPPTSPPALSSLGSTTVSPITRITPQPLSLAHSAKLAEVSSQSQSLVDESIGQLKELMKLSTQTLWSQDAKHRDPNMVNAAVNSAKAITNLLRIKLEAAKLK